MGLACNVVVFVAKFQLRLLNGLGLARSVRRLHCNVPNGRRVVKVEPVSSKDPNY